MIPDTPIVLYNEQKNIMDLRTLRELVAIDSPTGFTSKATDYIAAELTAMGYTPRRTRKGALACALGERPTLALAAHTDTLGAMVSGIRGDGTLAFTLIGGLMLHTAEGEYVRIYTRKGQVYTGTFLLNNPSTHVNATANSADRNTASMHVRLDEEVSSAAEVESLGIAIGDFICIDPRYTETPSGFVKSRFMDNKASCYVLLEVARALKQQGRTAPVELFFSTYEEVGHGGTCGYADTIEDLLVLDMGVVGDTVAGKENACSICAKDSTGPYDYGFRTHLVELAEKHGIPYKLDVYPFYGSDGSAAWRAGRDYRVALIGPGVAASHGAERTHVKGLKASIDLCLAYIDDVFPAR